MQFLDALPASEAKVRRHVPSCDRVEDVSLRAATPARDNPAPFELRVDIRRIAPDPAPIGWGHDLMNEIRAGWNGNEFALLVAPHPSDFEETTGQYDE